MKEGLIINVVMFIKNALSSPGLVLDQYLPYHPITSPTQPNPIVGSMYQVRHLTASPMCSRAEMPKRTMKRIQIDPVGV